MVLNYIAFAIFFVKILSVSCEKQYGSLTFVIDDTFSMNTEIALVKDAASRFMDIVLLKKTSQIKDIVLVTFNDPEYETKLVLPQSRDRGKVQTALNNIRVYGGADCPEYSLSGISKGITESQKNSYLFVFTDASPKDGWMVRLCPNSYGFCWTLDETKVADVKKLAQSRGSQIFFFLTKSPDNCTEQENLYKPYWDIAKATNGQVFKLRNKKDVTDLLPFLEIVISGGGDTITRVEVPANKEALIPFEIDDQTEYVVISASSPDGKVQLGINKGPTKEFQIISWNNNNKIIKINNPVPGSYEASVLGSNDTTVMIFGRTDFTFQHGFSETVPPTFRGDKKQPTDGIKSHLLIKVSDPTRSVNIKYVQIMSADEKTVYHTLPLTKKQDNYYTTQSFLAPNTLFLITVIGEGIKTHKEIKRTAKTPIEPRPRNTDPIIKIEGGGTYEYNGKVELTCNVRAYPKPVITWKDSKGNIFPGSSSEQTSKYDHKSTISIQHIKHKTALYCFAAVGANENSERVDLDVNSPFIINEDESKASVLVEFGDPAILQCNVRSKFPMRINWYKKMADGHYIVLKNSPKVGISSDGTWITVSSIDQEDVGKYYCVPYLTDDASTAVLLERDIALKHTAPVMGEPVTIRVTENYSVVIKCNVLKAYPKPRVNWMYKEPGSNEFKPLNKEGEVLRIDRANLRDAGVYQCIAINEKGSNAQETTIIVRTIPKVKILVDNEEKTTVNVDYGKSLELSCQVTSHSPPEIVWKNKKNEVVKSEKTVANTGYNEYKSILTISTKRATNYYCEAINELGKESVHVSVLVNDPLHVQADNSFIKVEYGEEATIKCGVTSRMPLKITWIRETGETVEKSDKYSISEDGTFLKIKQAKLDTRGKYICKASIVDDEEVEKAHATTVELNIEKPVIEKQPSVTVFYNQTAVLKCHILKGIPKPTITWQVKKDNETKFTALSEEGEELKVPSAKYYDTGLYKCDAKNVIGTFEQTVKLIVQAIPKVKILVDNEEKTTVNVDYGKSLELSCQVTSHSPPEIVWKNEKNEVVKSEKTVANTGYNEYKSILTISTKRATNYYCEAINELGKESVHVSVLVNDPLYVQAENSFIKVEYGEEATIKCGVTSRMPLKITWIRETGETVEKSDKYSISEDGTFMKIKQAKLDTRGKYICKASIVDDEEVEKAHATTVELNIEKPEIEKQPSVTVFYNQTAVLKCHILKGIPKPTITWQVKKDNETKFTALSEEGEELKVPSAKYYDTGLYKCDAKNVIGTFEQTVKLIVQAIPKVKILVDNEEKTTVNVDYGKSLELSCQVTSHSPPEIVWKNEKNEVVKSEKTVANTGYNEYKSILTISTKRDTNYYCEAINELGKESVHVSVLVNDPLYVQAENSFIKVEYGEEATIKCGVLSRMPLKITWIRETGETVEKSDKYSISEDGTFLKIKQAKLDTRGKYICKASIVDDEEVEKAHATTVELNIEKPEIEKQPSVTVFYNQTAVLKCHILKGIPKPTITWQVKKDNETKFTALSEEGEELKVPSAKHYDTGLYKCDAKNVIGTFEQTVKLIVQGPPQILSDEDKIYTAVVGDVTLRIPCVAVGHPKPLITWQTGSKYSAPKYTIDEDGTLVINNPQIEDTKGYKCTATNKFGSNEKTFEGYVTEYIDKDEDVGDITYIDLLNDETRQLDCASGSSKGRWFKEWYPMNLKGVLTIENARRKDEGNYTCRVSDVTGSKSQTYIVIVGYPPTLDDLANEDVDWNGRDKWLSCPVTMWPSTRTAKAEWFYNGKSSNSSSGDIQASMHPIISWGKYTCKISNVHGQVTKNINVHSSGCLMKLESAVTKFPLVMNGVGNWPHFTITEHYFAMPSKETLMLSCPNQGNKFHQFPKKTEIIGTCDHEDKFSVDGNTYKFSDLQCKSEVSPTIQETGDKCLFENTEYIKVGYNVQHPDPHFLEVYRVCFDTIKKIPLYTKLNVTSVNRIRLENAAWQKYDKYYIEKDGELCDLDSNCCLKNHQLVNDLDVIPGPGQSATFIEGLNTVPYWSDCKPDIWSQIENEIRSHIRKPYTVISGGYEYSDKNGTSVPRYLWKIVKKSTASIAIVYVNDLSPKPDDILCGAKCPIWMSTDPYIFCCNLAEFQMKMMRIMD